MLKLCVMSKILEIKNLLFQNSEVNLFDLEQIIGRFKPYNVLIRAQSSSGSADIKKKIVERSTYLSVHR